MEEGRGVEEEGRRKRGGGRGENDTKKPGLTPGLFSKNC